ncbi:hypothetical protein B0T20DRAFT_497412 [Sordaria brevicollis]|uniref:Uncharacterized protein n=1 Tax=Sordaria brevicollis TaxID=83679 RepID=A0AAE0UD97_SORBR|nr:hypothetical protein B0T20DRAFT_497412 [Sordaria brevicollis]
MASIFGSFGSIFGPRKDSAGSLPTPSPNSDREIANSNIPTSDHNHDATNAASSSSEKRAMPNNAGSSDDDCMITAIHSVLQHNPVQPIPKREETEGEEPFGGRFRNIPAARTGCSSTGKEDNGVSQSTANASNKEDVHGSNQSTGAQRIFGTGPAKRPLVVDDDEPRSRNGGSFASSKKRRVDTEQHRLKNHHRQISTGDHSRKRLKDSKSRPSSLARSVSNLDDAKSKLKELAKSIRNTPITAGAKATEKIQHIKERPKEAQTAKPTQEQVVQEFLHAPIGSIGGPRLGSNPTDAAVGSSSHQHKTTGNIVGGKTVPTRKTTDNIVSPNSQRNRDTRGTQGDKNQAPNIHEPTFRKTPAKQPTHQNAQAKQPSHSTGESSRHAAGEADAALFKHFEAAYKPEKTTVRIVNKLPIPEERTGYRFTSQHATDDSHQLPREDGRPTRAALPRKRNKPAQASSSKLPPSTQTVGTTIIPSASPTPPEPTSPVAPVAPVAPALPPAPPRKAVPAESVLAPTEIIFQYVIYHTQKYDPDTEAAHNRRDNVYTSKKEANETCRQRFRDLVKADTAFETIERHIDRYGLFVGRITYEDGDVQDYYVREEQAQLGDLVQKRKLWLDEEGVGIYTKRLWDVWSVRYYPVEEETKQQDGAVGVESGRVEEVLDEGDEGDEGDDADDGEEEEDLFADRDIEGQRDHGTTELGAGVVQENDEASGVMAGEVDTPGEANILATSEHMTDSQTEGNQTQTQDESQTQQISSDDDQSNPTPSNIQAQTLSSSQTHPSLPENPKPQPEPISRGQTLQQPQAEAPTARDTAQQSRSGPINGNGRPRLPTPPLPCDLYTPPPPSTIYSSDSDEEDIDISPPRTLPNNIRHSPPCPSMNLDPKIELHATFTTLRLANLEVLKVFEDLTRPESGRIDDVMHWRDVVLSELKGSFRLWTYENTGPYVGEDGDAQAPEYGDNIEHSVFRWPWKPPRQYRWRFRKIEVWVEERKLVGPKDLGGLEVKIPKEKSLKASQPKTGAPESGSGSGTAAASSSTAPDNSNTNTESQTGTSTGNAPGGTSKTNGTSTLTEDLGNQHAYFQKIKAKVKANQVEAKKKKPRRRPTAKEKGKGKAVDFADPVATTATEPERQGNYRDGRLEVIMDVDDPVVRDVGDGEEEEEGEGEVSEEE